MIEGDAMMRTTPICDAITFDMVGERKELVITKDEFLACYYAWVKGEEK